MRLVASVTEQIQQFISDSLTVQSRIDVDAILDRVTSAIAREVPVTCMAVLLKSEPGMSRVVVQDVENPAMTAHIDRFVGTLIRPGVAPTTGLTQSVVDAGGPIFEASMPYDRFLALCSPETQAYLARNPCPMPIENVTMLMVPMRSGPAIVGTLSMFDWRGGSTITEDDGGWMQAVAHRVGLLVDSAQLRNCAIDRIERIGALNQAALAISSSQDLRVTLKLILERVIATLHVDAADFLLIDVAGSSFYVAASLGFRATTSGEYTLPAPGEAISRALLGVKAGAPPAMEWMDQLRRGVIDREGFRYHVAYPLVLRDSVVGGLEVFSRTVLETDPEWTAFLDVMASQAAIAVDNASMRAALRKGRQP